ncbi:hypothetical protein JOL62DRAFT_249244 [Phyllosticta paracitricarpa]|uniref:Uncharacterized protein n=1 Tax=Phyllosticta paracitricarpa TaxID=2016321 RepID=A0ABR1MY79_9PEZI
MALPTDQPMTQQQTFQQTGTFVQPTFMYPTCASPAFGPQLQPQFDQSQLQQQLFQLQQQVHQQVQQHIQFSQLQQLQSQIQQVQQQLQQQNVTQQVQQTVAQQQQQQLQQQQQPFIQQPHFQQPHFQQHLFQQQVQQPLVQQPHFHHQQQQQQQRQFAKQVQQPLVQQQQQQQQQQHILPQLPQPQSPRQQPRQPLALLQRLEMAKRASRAVLPVYPPPKQQSQIKIPGPPPIPQDAPHPHGRTPSVKSAPLTRSPHTICLPSTSQSRGLQGSPMIPSAPSTHEEQRLSTASRRSFHSLRHQRTLSQTTPTNRYPNRNRGAAGNVALVDSKNVTIRAGPVQTASAYRHLTASTTVLVDPEEVATSAFPVPTTPAMVNSENVANGDGPFSSRYRRREIIPDFSGNAAIDSRKAAGSLRGVLKKPTLIDFNGSPRDKAILPDTAAKPKRIQRMSVRFSDSLTDLHSRFSGSGRGSPESENQRLPSSLIKIPHTKRARSIRKIVNFLNPTVEDASDSSSGGGSIDATTGSNSSESTPPSSIMSCEVEQKIPESSHV